MFDGAESMVNFRVDVILPQELGDDYEVEYDKKCNNVTATIRKKFDFNNFRFENRYEFLKPVSDRLEEYGIITNNLEVWNFNYLMMTIGKSSKHSTTMAMDIANALGICTDRVRCIESNRCYCILKHR